MTSFHHYEFRSIALVMEMPVFFGHSALLLSVFEPGDMTVRSYDHREAVRKKRGNVFARRENHIAGHAFVIGKVNFLQRGKLVQQFPFEFLHATVRHVVDKKNMKRSAFCFGGPGRQVKRRKLSIVFSTGVCEPKMRQTLTDGQLGVETGRTAAVCFRFL